MSQEEFLYTSSQFKELCETALKTARDRGATSAEIDVNEGLGRTVSVRKGDIETLEYNRDTGLGVTVYIGQQRDMQVRLT